MAAVNPSMVSGGDRRQGLGFPPRRQGAPQYVWTASAPSPAVVSELEALFPDIVQLPMAAIDIEAKVWSECGMIIRSLSRWVPPEAIVREFHRAGLAGRIETISLSHRSALIKFEFPTARDAALIQPWVVNGQPLAVAAWHSDFVPADDALTSALLWLRLPNLPIEYWSDETLSSIVAVAGQFVAVDAATKQRSRGGFARVCVRVELSRPLRPGARIRANGTPFWQSFVYEHVEGICYHCGSLHLTGPCASSLEPASSTAAPRFGPWMAALRHRKPASGAGSSSPMSSSVQKGDAGKEPLSVDDGWMTPRKTARRRSQLSPLAGNVVMLGEGSPGVAEPCRQVASVPVTVATEHCSDSPSLKSKPREKKSPQLP